MKMDITDPTVICTDLRPLVWEQPEEEQKGREASPTGSGGRPGSSGRASPPVVSDPRHGLAPISTSRSSSEEGTGAEGGNRTRAALPMSRQGSSSGMLASALFGQGASRAASNGAAHASNLGPAGQRTTPAPTPAPYKRTSASPPPDDDPPSYVTACLASFGESPPSLIEGPRCPMPSARDHGLPGGAGISKPRLPPTSLVPAVRRVSFEVAPGSSLVGSSSSLPVLATSSPPSPPIAAADVSHIADFHDDRDGPVVARMPPGFGQTFPGGPQEPGVVGGFGFGDLDLDAPSSGPEAVDASDLLGDDLLMMRLEGPAFAPPAGHVPGSTAVPGVSHLTGDALSFSAGAPPQIGGLKAALAQCADAERNSYGGVHPRSEGGNSSHSGDVRGGLGFGPGSSRHSDAQSFLPTSGLQGKGYGLDGSFNSSNGSGSAASGAGAVATGT
jgi:hypothetical protein